MNRLKCRVTYAPTSLAVGLMLLRSPTQAAPFACLSKNESRGDRNFADGFAR
jgi:hypothetical protein